MKILKWEDYKFKFFNLTLFKIGKKKDGINFYILFIPILKFKNEFSIISTEIKENTNFNMKKFDEKIASFIEVAKQESKNFSKEKIAYMATELYETGGHTKCLINQIKSLSCDYEECLFLTKKTSTYKNANKSISIIEKYAKVEGINENFLFYKKQAVKLYEKIIDFGAKTLFIYIHPDDILATLVISLIKRNTDIKIIFFNHSSHYPNLGMTFADLILEGMPSALKITNEKRQLYNCAVIGLQSKEVGETNYISKDEIQNIRKELGINDNEIMTISGGASYKFFNQNKSEYFEMIKEILETREDIKHVIMTKLKKNEIKIFNEIFKDENTKKQIIFTPLSPDYEKFFQVADLFIDSFPVSSALTQIDLMRLKVPTVVKINKDKPEWSFHEYMPIDYKYMFENVQDMKNGIFDLIENKSKREEIIKSNYEFWLKTYESNRIKQKYIQFINNFSAEIKLVNFNDIPYELQLETRNWRNSKQVAEYLKIPYIDEETHKNWLNSLKKENPSNIAFIIEYQTKPIGVTYFHSIDYEKHTCDWGIYIYAQEYRGKKIGDIVLKQCIDYASQLGIKIIKLDVLNTNKNAKKLYENNGFQQTNQTEEKFLRYARTI